MAFKIQIISNAVEISDTVSGEVLISQPARDSWFEEESLDKDLIVLYGTTSTNEDNIKKYRQNDSSFVGFPIADCVDSTDTVFTTSTFRTFCYVSLGKSSASGGGEDVSIENRVIVNQTNIAETLGGVIDSTKEYFIDGSINMGVISCTVPAGGIKISGLGSNISMLFSTEDNYTMFVSDVGGCGDCIQTEIEISVTGNNSSVYALTSTGFSVWEVSRLIWTDCTSLGYLDSFVQGLETVTSRLGGTPELELIGNWISGYKVETSNSRGLVAGSYSLFKAGTGFVINGRFGSNQLADLASGVSLFDFSGSNFANASALQLENAFVTRNGVSDASDSLLTPNISAGELQCSWKDCVGLSNTHVGGACIITTEIQTSVTQNVYSDLAGVYQGSDLEHFSFSPDGYLTHLGDSPREYNVLGNLVIDGGSNDEVWLKVVVWDNSESSFIDYKIIKRQISNLQGGRDVGYFNFVDRIILDKDDYVKLMVTNVSDNTDVTAELDSEFIVEAR